MDLATDFDEGVVAGRIEEFLREQVDSYERDGAIVGMSGGLDSAVVAALLARALGPERVLAVFMPERDTNPQSKLHAMKEVERLGVRWQEFDITPILSALGIYKLVPLKLLGSRRVKESVVKWQHRAQREAFGEPPFARGLLGTRGMNKNKGFFDSGLAYARAKHRSRLLVLYYLAEQGNLLVVGTNNKTESLIGFGVKWGDNVADVEPILPLYKTQVHRLALHLGVTQDIITKPPSPDMMPGIEDETALGMSYDLLDQILAAVDQDGSAEQVAEKTGAPPEQIAQVKEMMRRSLHMRELPPAPRLG